jgi:hypothetical protein
MDDLEDYTCPITMQVYYDPVIASDGFTYEHQIIYKIWEMSGKSPMTRQALTDKFRPNTQLRKKIKKIIKKNPIIKKDRFVEEYYISPNFFHNNIDKFRMYVKAGGKVALSEICELKLIAMMKNNNLFLKIISICDDIIPFFNKCSHNLIKKIFGITSFPIIKKIIDKIGMKKIINVLGGKFKFTPLHFIVAYSNVQILKSALNYYRKSNIKVDSVVNNFDYNILHCICDTQTIAHTFFRKKLDIILKCFLDNKFNLGLRTKTNYDPLRILISNERTDCKDIIIQMINFYDFTNFDFKRWNDIYGNPLHSSSLFIRDIIQLLKLKSIPY